MKKENLTAHLAVLGANIIFGLNYVIAKGIMPHWMEPRAIIFLRVTGATAAFWLVEMFAVRERVARKDLKRMFVIAFFGVALNQILFFEGLNLTTPINASIIMVGTPILVLVMSRFVIGDKISARKLMGIILGFSGAAFLILRNGHLTLSSDTTLGNLLVLINAASYGLFLVMVKPLMSKYRPLTVMKWVFTFGLVFVIPVSIGEVVRTNFSIIPLNIWFSIMYVVIFTTIFAYFLNNYSLQKISPSANSSYMYLQPVLASLVAIFAGKDKLTMTEVVASLLIFAGVFFVNKRRVAKVAA
ncbi:MAG TPA: EamA/RhaT family transporter [Bacteroidetes bacterium]|nr:EamA/RhaT family transporter [Bacteroidota bacterium]